MSDGAPDLNTCGCCAGVDPLTPAMIENRPGLAALAYRAGTHATFKATMQAALAREPSLRALATREDDDPAIALLDAWATVLDVLSFYEERIANEAFLRTATERRSILELARAIGYELRPGVAAGTFLAFTLETAPGAPLAATIGIGTKGQSIPAQDQRPQIFETVEEIEARAAWNALTPQMRERVLPKFGDDTLYLQGVATNLKPGDALLVIGDERELDPGSEAWDFRRVHAVKGFPATSPTDSYTVVTLDRGLGSIAPHVEPAKQNPKVYALRQRVSLFGCNAPEWRAMAKKLRADYLGISENDASLPLITEWPNFNLAAVSGPPSDAASGTGLYAEYYDALDFTKRALTRIDPQVDFALSASWPPAGIAADTFSVRWTGWIQPKSTGACQFSTFSDDGVRLWVNGALLINEWNDHAPTKHTALRLQLEAGRKYDITLEFYQRLGGATIRLLWSGPGFAEEVVPTANLYPRSIHELHLDGIHSEIVTGSWVVLSVPGYQEVYRVDTAVEDSRSRFALSSKTMRLTLSGENLHEKFNERLRETVVFCQSELLEFAPRPISPKPGIAPVAGESVVVTAVADGLTPGRLLAVTGVDATTVAGDNVATGKTVSEIVTLKTAEPAGDAANPLTKLTFTAKLERSYVRDSVTINTNVARATHGETKTEVLGGAEGARAFQKFTLKQKPLTYVSAPTASGAESTLRVWVNGLLWDEAPSFFQLPPDARAHTMRFADDGTATVQFGDGRHGARPPSGAENVTASYRVGTGLEGLVAAEQISLLLSRPLGAKGVVNPLAPTGAADPEKLDDARRNAPLTVLTLDRIVSLQDFEDFARAFSGIGKAQAALLWNGEQRLVHLTVAGADGSPVTANSDLYKNLLAAIDSARHPDQPVRVDSALALSFNIEAKILVDPRRIAADVLSAVAAAVLGAFSFESRAFGQAVTESEVVAAMQRLEGVVAVDLDKLHFTTLAPSLETRLPAHAAYLKMGQVLAAELLTVNPDGIKLTAMTP